MTNQTKITIRANGKCHPAIVVDGMVMVCCQCPGSQNGQLARAGRQVADGHERANCRIK